jgi:predicted Co/Zn/Cd cation transporter (cation efflux family)
VIIDSMNANLALTLERFGANSVIGYAVNSQLANTDISTRVIVAMPTGYSFNGTEFIYTAPIAEPLAPIENEI